ncbi:MAG: phage major capsid protein [Vicinamibacterales bacterium]
MDIQEFITTTARGPIGLDVLTSLAADSRSFGDDAQAAFRTQAELRQAAAQQVLDVASAGGRDSLLASEQRSFDRATQERDSVLALARGIEARTQQRAFVPATQVTSPAATETTDASPVLTRDAKMGDWLQRRGGYAYVGERGAETMRFGRIVRALALGNRAGLSALEQRALSEGSDSSGGYTVPEVLATRFIDRVRDALIVQRAGAQIVPMTSDTLHIARLAQPTEAGSPAITTAQWKLENADIEETSLLLERVTFTAHTLPVLLKLSCELADDSVNIDQIIERELAAQLASELDRAALFGSGTAPEPKGLVNQDGVDVASLSGAVDYDALIDAAALVAGRNFTPTARIYSTQVAASLAKLRTDGATGAYLTAPAYLDSIPAYTSNAIATTGSPATTTLIVGAFDQMLIGIRSTFRLEVSRVAGTAFEKMQVWVRAYLRADVQLAHPEAFVVREDATL